MPDQFRTRPALILMGLTGLVLAYFLASRAIDTGSLWQYLGAAIVSILSIRLIIRSFKSNK